MLQRVLCALVAAALLASSGCSMLFMETLPSSYDGSTPPRCTSTKGWVALDAIFIVTNLASMAAPAETEGERTAYVIGGILGAAIHAYSAIQGNSDADDCRDAQRQWDQRPQWVPEDEEPPPPPPPPAYFCTTAPADTSYGACARSLDACGVRQRALVDGGVDATPCVSVEAAVCFAAMRTGDGGRVESCFPTVASCRRQQQLAVEKPDAYSGVTECADAR